MWRYLERDNMISKILGIAILIGCFVVVYMFETTSNVVGWMRIFHWPAILLTGIGPIGLLLIASDPRTLWEALSLLFHSPKQIRNYISTERRVMQELSEKYYTVGTRSFEQLTEKNISRSFASVLEKLALRIPIADIRFLLAEQQDSLNAEISRGIGVFGLAVRLAPSIGMLGTILGMVNLLSSLQDPSQIGSSMSLALLTTFYGLFFSLALWSPLQHRLQSMLDAQNQEFDLIDHWLALLETRKPPEYMARERVIGK